MSCEQTFNTVSYNDTRKASEKAADARGSSGMSRREAPLGPRTLDAGLLSRYQTGAPAKNRLGGDGGCRGDWKGAAR